MDNVFIELKISDGSMVAINTIAVKNEISGNIYQRSELNRLRSCDFSFKIHMTLLKNDSFVIYL